MKAVLILIELQQHASRRSSRASLHLLSPHKRWTNAAQCTLADFYLQAKVRKIYLLSTTNRALFEAGCKKISFCPKISCNVITNTGIHFAWNYRVIIVCKPIRSKLSGNQSKSTALHIIKRR